MSYRLQITDLVTGQTWPSTQVAGKALYISPEALQHMYKQYRDGFPYDMDGHRLVFKRVPLGRPVRCIETGQIYPNIKAASKAFGRNAGSLPRSIKNGYTWAGHTWEYVKAV